MPIQMIDQEQIFSVSNYTKKIKVEAKQNQTEQKLCSSICEHFQLSLEKYNFNHKCLSSVLNLETTIFTLEPTWAKQDPVLPHLNMKLREPRPKPGRNLYSKNRLYKTGSLMTPLQPQRKIFRFLTSVNIILKCG